MNHRLTQIFLTGLFTLLPLGAVQAASEQAEILYLTGKVQVQVEKEWKDVTPMDPLNLGQTYRVGSEQSEKDIDKQPSLQTEQALAVSLPNGDTLTVNNGSEFTLTQDQDTLEIQLEGRAHLFSMRAKAAKHYQIFGLGLELSDSHLYLEGSSKKQSILVVGGSAKAQLTLGAKGAKAAKDEINLGEKIEIQKGDIKVLKKQVLDDHVLVASLLPGFEKLTRYQRTGHVIFRGGDLQIKRGQSSVMLSISPSPVLEGDEIVTKDKQRARLMLVSEDKIDISPGTTFKIEEFKHTEEDPSYLYSFAGEAKAQIAKKRQANRMVKFRSVTTTIGVKGTEFFVQAGAQGSQVATLEGLVSVADPTGAGEMLLEQGQMTNVPMGGLPAAPTVIPAALLQALAQDFLEMPLEQPTPSLGAALGILALLSVGGDSAAAPAPAAPQLLEALPMGGLSIYPGKSVALSWDQELALSSARLGEQTIATNLDATTKIMTLDVGDLLAKVALLPPGTPATLSIEVESKAGGKNQVQTELKLLTLPALVQELSAKGLPIKPGVNPALVWNVSLAKASVKIGEQVVQSTLDEAATTLTLDQADLVAKMALAPQGALVIAVESKDGVPASLETQPLMLSAPVIKEAVGRTLVTIQQAIQVQSEQTLSQWSAKIRQGEQEIKTLNLEQPGNQWSLQPESLADLAEGEYQLIFTAVDEYQMLGNLTLQLLVDRSGPRIAEGQPSLDLVLLGDQQSMTLQLTEAVDKVEVTLGGKPWHATLGEGGKLVTLVGSAKILNNTPQELRLALIDSNGNQTLYTGVAMLKPPREQALRQAYQQGQLQNSQEPAASSIRRHRGELLIESEKAGREPVQPPKVDISKVKEETP